MKLWSRLPHLLTPMSISSPLIPFLALVALISAAVGVHAWRRRPDSGAAGALAVVLWACGWWSLVYAVELSLVTVAAKLWCIRLEYVGIVAVPVAWLAFALCYTGRAQVVTPPRLALFLLEPALVLVAVWSTPVHSWYYSHVGLGFTLGMVVLDTEPGPLYWVHVAYSYGLMLAATVLLVTALQRSAAYYRSQVGVLLLAALLPWATNAAYVFRASPFSDLDLTNVAFVASGLLAAWGLFRLRLLDVLPVAHHAVLAAMSDGVLVLDGRGHVVEANLVACRALGQSAPGLVGRPAHGLPEPWGPALGDLDALGGDTREISTVREGAARCYELQASALQEQNGRTVGRIVMIRDITERKKTEEALREALQRFASVIEHTPTVAIQGFDRNGVISTWNKASEVLYGFSAEEVVGRRLQDVLLPETEAEQFVALVDQIWRSGEPAPPREWQVVTRDGRSRWVYSSMFPIFSGGEVCEVFCMDVDITDRKLAEQSQRLAAVGQLAAGVAHEFNNLLAAMMLKAEMQPVREGLPELVLRLGKRGADICRNLAAFAHPEPLSKEAVSINAVVESALRAADREISDSSVTVHTDLSVGECRVIGDPAQLQLVFLNLITNACHAMPGGGALTIQAKCTVGSEGGPEIVVSVADTGRGIPPEHLPHIFEPFFTTKGSLGGGDIPGTGLGLSLCHSIISAHGGTISVASQVGRGTTFVIRLPAVEAEASGLVAQDPETRDEPRGEPTTVLVADGDEGFREWAASLLEGQGRRVVSAASADQTIAALGQVRPHVVLLGSSLPGGGAQRVLEAARHAPRRPAVVVISDQDSHSNEHGRRLLDGACVCAHKPLSAEALLDLVSAALEAPTFPPPKT